MFSFDKVCIQLAFMTGGSGCMHIWFNTNASHLDAPPPDYHTKAFLVSNGKSFLIPPVHQRSLWSEIVTEVVPVIGSIEWLCNSVLRRAKFSTRHALQAVRNIHQHTPFHWWRDEGPHASIRKESMHAPVLVEQESKSPTVCVQVLAYIRQLSQGWM